MTLGRLPLHMTLDRLLLYMTLGRLPLYMTMGVASRGMTRVSSQMDGFWESNTTRATTDYDPSHARPIFLIYVIYLVIYDSG